MTDIKWIKIATDIFDNKKIRMIEAMPEGDAIIVIWFKLLMLAGQTNDGGLIYFTKDIPYTEQMLSTYFNKPLTIIQLALTTFERFGMVELIDDVIYVSNWEEYQNVEGMEKIREQNRIRQKRWYDKQKVKTLPNVRSNEDITSSNGTDIDIDIDIRKDISKDISKRKSFIPPTLEEVQEYCKERGNHIDAQTFIDFYSAKGWMIGKNKMKDWKAAVRTWERNNFNKTKAIKKDDFQQTDMSDALSEIEDLYMNGV